MVMLKASFMLSRTAEVKDSIALLKVSGCHVQGLEKQSQGLTLVFLWVLGPAV